MGVNTARFLYWGLYVGFNLTSPSGEGQLVFEHLQELKSQQGGKKDLPEGGPRGMRDQRLPQGIAYQSIIEVSPAPLSWIDD